MQLHNQSWGGTLVAALHHLRGIDKVLENAAPGDETGPVGVNKAIDLALQPIGKAPAENVDITGLQGDGAEKHYGRARSHAWVDPVEISLPGLHAVEHGRQPPCLRQPDRSLAQARGAGSVASS